MRRIFEDLVAARRIVRNGRDAEVRPPRIVELADLGDADLQTIREALFERVNHAALVLERARSDDVERETKNSYEHGSIGGASPVRRASQA